MIFRICCDVLMEAADEKQVADKLLDAIREADGEVEYVQVMEYAPQFTVDLRRPNSPSLYVSPEVYDEKENLC